MIEQFYTREEIRNILKIKTDAAIIRLEKRHLLNPIRIGRIIRYSEKEVSEMLGVSSFSDRETAEANSF